MSAWLDDRQRDPVRFPHIPWELSWAVGYQRDRCRVALADMREAQTMEDFPDQFIARQEFRFARQAFRFAWRDYRGLMARVGEINRNRRKLGEDNG